MGLKKALALELYRKLYQNKVKLHELTTLFWECTLRCNLSCRHCGSDCKKVSEFKDMPLNDFMSVIDNITPHVNPNKVLIILTGGEPLVRRDVEACGLELYKRGFPWGLVTNGMLLNRARLDALLASGLHTITVSLDGFEQEHNWLRGRDQSFKNASEAIKLIAQEKDLSWDVVTCVTPKNYDSLEEFKHYLISIGVKEWRLFTVFPVGRGAVNKELQLSDEQFVGLMEFIKNTRSEKNESGESVQQEGRLIDASFSCEGFLGKYEGEVRDKFYSCRAGVNVASVLADGSISACPSIRSNFHQGNIYTDSFIDVWNNSFEKFRNRDWAKKGECQNCKQFRYCLGSGMHLRDENEDLLVCHYHKVE